LVNPLSKTPEEPAYGAHQHLKPSLLEHNHVMPASGAGS